ncbi:hypothetical protein DCAR_0830854 [Daucus carota subsp. sativus]|uniref:Uncharacterized protein n=1 Tax=Daucus carota subsp. sativus TaxID=79200 RepID=A0A175YLK1_DAUCS|nr:hypothetical protein DCAR_0830854 [Daucus carota subsp. sativus]
MAEINFEFEDSSVQICVMIVYCLDVGVVALVDCLLIGEGSPALACSRSGGEEGGNDAASAGRGRLWER